MCLIMVVIEGIIEMKIDVKIGNMYWEKYIYIDEKKRIKMGKIKGEDF